MDPERASMTALGAAYRRAYHYTHDTPKVFEDPFAALFVAPDEATAIEKSPPVVGTYQARNRATVSLAHLRATVGAPIDKGTNPTVISTHTGDRCVAKPSGNERPRLGELAFVRKKQPPGMEQLVHLELEQARIGVDRRMDFAVAYPLAIEIDAKAG